MKAVYQLFKRGYSGLSFHCWERQALSFVNSSACGVVYYLAMYFVSTLSLNMFWVGILLSIFGIGTMLGSLVCGILSDKFGAHRIAKICLLLTGLAFLVLFSRHSIYSVSVIVFVLGFATYGFSAVNAVIIMKLYDDAKHLQQRAINVSRAVQNSALGLSVLVASVMAEYSYKVLFYSIGILAILAFLHVYLRERNVQVNRRATPNEIFGNRRDGRFEVRRNVTILYLCMAVILVGIIFAQLRTTYGVYISQTFPALGYRGFAFLFALNTFLVVLFQVPVMEFFSQHNKITLVGIGAFLSGFGMFILSFSHFFSIAIFSCIVWTVGEIFFFAASRTLSFELSDKGKKGLGQGMYQLCYSISLAAGPIIGGGIYHAYGSDALWYFCLLLGITCLGFVLVFKKFLFCPRQTDTAP